MKKYSIITIIIIIALIAFFLRPRASATPASTAMVTQPASVKVSPIKTQVFVSPRVDQAAAAYGAFSEIATSTDATENDKIKTSSDGRALIEGNHTAVVDSDSEVTIASLMPAEEHTGLNLESGKIWARAQKLLDKGEYYEIETKNAHAVVRGTSFGVDYQNDTTILMVTDGAVLFTTKNPAADATADEKEVLVVAGKKATLVGNGKIKLEDISKADASTEWFMYNNPHYVVSSNIQVSTPKITIPVKNAPVINAAPTSTPTPTPTTGSSNTSSSNTNPNTQNSPRPTSTSQAPVGTNTSGAATVPTGTVVYPQGQGTVKTPIIINPITIPVLNPKLITPIPIR